MIQLINILGAEANLCADDVVFSVSDKNVDIAISKLRQLIGYLSDWLSNNRFLPNLSKI